MDDLTLQEDLVQERQELMASPPENSKKSHLLKPCSTTSIDGSGAVLPHQNRPDLKALSSSVTFNGWRLASSKFKSWTTKMAALHKPIWRKAGIYEAVMSSTYRIKPDKDLVLGIAEKWCPDTRTFVFPWGETSITLEDVMVLLGFSVSGLPVFASLDASGERIKEKIEREWVKIKIKISFVTQLVWMERFMDSNDDMLEHVAFLVCWLSYFVFPLRYYHIFEAVFSIAVHLSSGTKIALAPAALAHLYAELTLLKNHIQAFDESKTTVNDDSSALFKLVQVWTWERFKELQPKPNQLQEGEPRLALWHKTERKIDDVRRILDNSNIDSFEWRPFTKPVKNWEFPRFYPEKAMYVPIGPNLDDEFTSFARFIKVSELVGIDNMEHYFPDRVASQFGILQNVPGPVNRNNLSKEEAWDHYNKPIDALALHIPSRDAIPSVTPMFCEWWRKAFQEFQSSSEKRQVVESSEMNRTSEVSRRKRRNYMILSCKKKGKTHAPSDNDVRLTVADIRRQNNNMYRAVKNSGGDVSEQLGKKTRLGADNNDSGPSQKRALISADGDEAVPPPETDETGSNGKKNIGLTLIDETNSSDSFLGANGVEVVVSPPETVQNCGDELDVYGSNADMIDGSSEEPNLVLQENGSIAGEKVRSDEKLCSEAEKEDDVVDNERLVQENVAIKEEDLADNNGPTSRDYDDSYKKRKQELEVLASSMETRIEKTERDLAWLKERRAIIQRRIAAARLI
ncbi:unnamed protein product [Arabis nemorensis]|uniref:Aminotransferase-like plant mobile domain-containing protein n=1 Tax=Arabis nemorensis TaxID=586526 RepID=A0A565BIU6_9BRAS|nr:unnamed protein product [Arabis nemorensis]